MDSELAITAEGKGVIGESRISNLFEDLARVWPGNVDHTHTNTFGCGKPGSFSVKYTWVVFPRIFKRYG